jgi:pimeloyl-ACP methyl ester carboxylesterase
LPEFNTAGTEAWPVSVRVIDGIDVRIEGFGERTMIMVHGWPDTWRLWDAQVAHFAPSLRCVRFTLPGFDIAGPRRAYSLAELVAFIARVADAASPGRPVTLMLHDWGCLFGGQFAMRHPQRVERLILIDVGDAGSRANRAELGLSGALAIFAYQAWLALAWKIGGNVGDAMTRWLAPRIGCRSDPAWIGSCMNYPYWIQWTGTLGGYRGRLPLRPHCPVFYAWGERKPNMFHSAAWVDALRADPRHRAMPFPTGHWVVTRAAARFNAEVQAWLDGRPP